jgi:hypothetical protein
LNPDLQERLAGLGALRGRLRARMPEHTPARPLRRRQGGVLEAVSLVLERASRPLRVRDVHSAVEELFGERVPFSSVNEALSTHAVGEGAPFQRVRYGVYQCSGSCRLV